jgi:hypothetical protein
VCIVDALEETDLQSVWEWAGNVSENMSTQSGHISQKAETLRM